MPALGRRRDKSLVIANARNYPRRRATRAAIGAQPKVRRCRVRMNASAGMR